MEYSNRQSQLYSSACHIFEHGKTWILYDIRQGIFCEIDDLTRMILEEGGECTPAEMVAAFTPRYSEHDILNACAELQRAGIFSTDPPEYRSFVPPSRLEIVHLGLDLSSTTQEVAYQAIDLLMQESGMMKQCYVTILNKEQLSPKLIRQIIDYGLEQAQSHNKEIIFETTQSCSFPSSPFDDGNAHEQSVQEDDLNLSKSSDTYKNQVFVQDTEREVHIRGIVDRNTLNLSERIQHIVNQYSKVRSVTLKFLALPPNHPDAITRANLPEALNALEDLAGYVKSQVLNGGDVWIGDFEDCVVQVYNQTITLYHCGAGTRYLVVAPDGKLYVCPGLVGHDAFCFGTVLEGINRERQKQWIKSTHAEAFEDCRKCWARYLCGGGCRLNAFQGTGDIQKPDPIMCDLIRRSYELALSLCVDLYEEAPEQLEARYGEGRVA